MAKAKYKDPPPPYRIYQQMASVYSGGKYDENTGLFLGKYNIYNCEKCKKEIQDDFLWRVDRTTDHSVHFFCRSCFKTPAELRVHCDKHLVRKEAKGK